VKLRRAINPVFTDSIHCTRIAFKKFRYMVEGVPSLRSRCGRGQLAAMRRYQTSMGLIQDTEVLISSLEKFAKSRAGGAEPLTSIMAELTHRRMTLIRRYLKIADQLYSFWPLDGRSSSQKLDRGRVSRPVRGSGQQHFKK
jgi:CHAD domain-containing protein